MRPFLVVSVVLASAGPVAAEDADTLFVQGRELLSKGDAVGACEKFHAANRERPDAPSVLLNLGLCYEKQDKLATAIKWFRRTSDKAREAVPQTDDMKEFAAAADERRNALTENVASIKIDVSATQAETQVSVDGVRQDPNLLSDVILVDRGTHTIEASAPGMQSHVQEITIENREKAKPVAIPKLEQAPEPLPIGPPKSRRTRGFVVAGVGAGLLVGSVIAAVLVQDASKKEGSDLGDPDGDGGFLTGNYSGKGVALMTIFTVTGAAGVVGMALGGYWIAKPYAAQERRVAVTPVVAPGFSGLSFSGRF